MTSAGIIYNFHKRLLLPLFIANSFICFSQQIHPVKEPAVKRHFSETEMLAYEKASFAYSGLSKITAIDNTPALYYSKTEFWPEGSWGRGYASEMTAKQFYELIPGKYPAYYSSNPLMRVNHRFLTAHIYDYQAGINKAQNLEKIKKGIDNILTEQLPNGMFKWWNKRQTQINMLSTDYKDAEGNTVELNKASDYETAYGLNALCEYYHTDIDYRKPEVLQAIQMAEKGLTSISDFTSNTNNNIRGLGLWAISGSYRITKNKLALSRIRYIAKKIVSEQSKDGQWRTGGQDPIEYNGNTYHVFHDQKSFYHFMILRGLTEAFDVLPGKIIKRNVLNSIKSGVNHLIDHRMNPQAKGFLYAYDVLTIEPEPKPFYLSALTWYDFSESYTTMEVVLRLYDYSRNSDYFTKSEETYLANLTYTCAQWIEDDKEYFRPAAMYNFYMGNVGK